MPQNPTLLVPYRLDGQLRYVFLRKKFLYGEGTTLARPGRLMTFLSRGAAAQFASQQGISLDPEFCYLTDFDQIEAWLAQPRSETLDWQETLSAWDLLADMARSLSQPMADDQASSAVHEKLFLGCEDVPGIDHDWSADEIATLVRVLSSGLATVRRATANAG